MSIDRFVLDRFRRCAVVLQGVDEIAEDAATALTPPSKTGNHTA